MRGAAVLLAGICAATLAGLAGGFIVGRIEPYLAWGAWAIGLGVAGYTWRALRECSSPLRPLSAVEWAVIAAFALVALRSFLWVAFETGDEIRVLFVQNIGDLVKHWNYSRYIAAGAEFWPDNPHVAGFGIHYPIGVDLFGGMLLACGMSPIRMLVWTGLTGAALAGVMLMRWGRGFAVAGLLCNGGFLGWAILFGGHAADTQADVAWKNLFVTVFVTQRGYLYALPAGLLLMESWRRRISLAAGSAHSAGGPLPFWLELLLYASMPLFHLHTFLFLSFLMGCWILLGRSGIRWHALRLGMCALFPATGLVLLVTDVFHGSSTLRWQLGWMQGDQNPLVFWLGNFGLFLPLAAALALLLAASDGRFATVDRATLSVARHFVWPAGAVFLACAFVLFAPWEWDNIKLLFWAYLAILPFLWRVIIARFGVPLRACICVVLFLSGAMALAEAVGKTQGFKVAKRSEVAGIAVALKGIPVEARFGAAPVHDHPLMFEGRKMGMAYSGHLFGHGLEWQEPGRKLRTLMLGGVGWERAAEALEVDHIFWGARERKEYGAGDQGWRESAELVAAGNWGKVYRLGNRNSGNEHR